MAVGGGDGGPWVSDASRLASYPPSAGHVAILTPFGTVMSTLHLSTHCLIPAADRERVMAYLCSALQAYVHTYYVHTLPPPCSRSRAGHGLPLFGSASVRDQQHHHHRPGASVPGGPRHLQQQCHLRKRCRRVQQRQPRAPTKGGQAVPVATASSPAKASAPQLCHVLRRSAAGTSHTAAAAVRQQQIVQLCPDLELLPCARGF